MHSDAKNILCIFEKDDAGKWVLTQQSSEIVKQGEQIPSITSEVYGEFYIDYYNNENSSLNMQITKRREKMVYNISSSDGRSDFDGHWHHYIKGCTQICVGRMRRMD